MEKANISIAISFLILISSTLTDTQSDGIIITEQDYNGLQAFKHSISDPNGFLKTWNGTGIGACSGLWIGIKCAQGKVIVISLPWRGLGGQITEKINQLDALRKLSLHDNAISGRIPTSIGFLKDLRGVYLFSNRFSGSIPPSIGNCYVLQALDLSNNLFIGSIPLTLSNSSKLFRLNLSYNNLSGYIPEEIGRLSSIRVLDLSHNNFIGEIPNSLEHLVNLTTFDVSYNNLSGNVPQLLSKKFNTSSFVGNINLCGYSALANCNDSNIPSQFTASTPEHRRFGLKFIVMIASGSAIATLFVICSILLCCLLRQKKAAVTEKTTKEQPVPEVKAETTETTEKSSGKLVHFNGVNAAFAADDLLCATAEILGKSTYGTVYKAMLEDGSEVAVKRLREKYTKSAKEFEMEVNMLGKIRHVNVLEVRAYYLGPKGEKLLAFDFMSKGSLASFLHARGPESTIDWRTRLNIAKGVARGLNHLHNTANTIHGNLTSNNVLLDENTNPKIADFALHRLMTPAANSNAVAAATALGYRAPELHNMKKANAKTDIYGFGVMLLELITGKSPSGAMKDGVELAAWVKEVVKKEWSVDVFDVELVREAEKREEMVEVLKLALECVDTGPVRRPNADDVLRRLEDLGGGGGVGTSVQGGGGDV